MKHTRWWSVGVPMWKVRVTSVVPQSYCPPAQRSTALSAGQPAVVLQSCWPPAVHRSTRLSSSPSHAVPAACSAAGAAWRRPPPASASQMSQVPAAARCAQCAFAALPRDCAGTGFSSQVRPGDVRRSCSAELRRGCPHACGPVAGQTPERLQTAETDLCMLVVQVLTSLQRRCSAPLSASRASGAAC